VFENEEMIRHLEPNQSIPNQINLDPGGVIVTAQGEAMNFVLRFFTPQSSILEDPVTGSAHGSLIPHWSEKLGKESMVALKLSLRCGKLSCKKAGASVLISGEAVTYSVFLSSKVSAGLGNSCASEISGRFTGMENAISGGTHHNLISVSLATGPWR
jgi:predicted PhzF superfamily epimerase YddE/YHI9